MSSSASTDSIATESNHRTLAVIDSLFQDIDFSFDTLKINITKPTTDAESVKSIRIEATNGRIVDKRKQHRFLTEDYNRIDSIAFHQSAVNISEKHSATTRVYDPPGPSIWLFLIVIAGIVILWRITRA